MSRPFCFLKATFTFLAAVSLLPVSIVAADRPSLPGSGEILRKLVEHAKAWKDQDEIEEKQLSYRERVVTSKLQADGALREREEKVYQIEPLNGDPAPKLVQKNGKSPTPSDLKEEESRLKKEREASQKRKESNGENRIELNEELVGKYKFETVGEETIGSRPAFVLSFKPKSDNLPVRRRIDYALNRLMGKVWIDQEDYEIARADLQLAGSAQIGWGLIASLREFSLAFEQTKLPDGFWFVKHYYMTMDLRFLFTSVHQKQEGWLSDFKKANL